MNKSIAIAIATLLSSVALSNTGFAQQAESQAVAEQTTFWIQIEAQPTLNAAQKRVRTHAARLKDVSGFRSNNAWYLIAIGPFDEKTAALRLDELKRAGLISWDSFIVNSAQFERQFWPVGTNILVSQNRDASRDELLPAAPTEPTPPALNSLGENLEQFSSPLGPLAADDAQSDDSTFLGSETFVSDLPEETEEEARRSERKLDKETKIALQKALAKLGFFTGKANGAFGRDTRQAMSNWQSANGLDVTGILTSAQRERLVRGKLASAEPTTDSADPEETLGNTQPAPNQQPSFQTGLQSDGDQGVGDQVDDQLPTILPPKINALPPVEETENRLEALQSERVLDIAVKKQLQSELKELGFFDAEISGRMGRDTREAMKRWQAATGHPETGILSTLQRARVSASYQDLLNYREKVAEQQRILEEKRREAEEKRRQEEEQRRLEEEKRLQELALKNDGAIESADARNLNAGSGSGVAQVEITDSTEPLAVETFETVEQALASELELDLDQRQALQIALRDAGFYDRAIDGDFGRGTRRAMERWQADNGFAPTGVLTSSERAKLLNIELSAPEIAVNTPRTSSETEEEALASEAVLDLEARKILQQALKNEGVYDSSIDGAIGRGSRRAMNAWQTANNYEPTGVLTSNQRQALLSRYPELFERFNRPRYIPDETREEALKNEKFLSAQERIDVQKALKWKGVYSGVEDGSFGKGTRAAMSRWQQQQGYTDTGVLTTIEREDLVVAYLTMTDSIGLTDFTDSTAGISATIPAAMVKYSHHKAPFVHFEPITDDGISLVMISQAGDETTLQGLYDVLQTLRIVPQEGPRKINARGFTIEGQNTKITSYASVQLINGTLKGFILAWPVGDDERRSITLSTLKSSFTPIKGSVLSDTAGLADDEQEIDLISGLEIRRPSLSRSGFFVDEKGSILTALSAVNVCGSITIEGDTKVKIAASDPRQNIALLQSSDPLEPFAYASFLNTLPRIGSDIAIAGYSFEGRLGAPSISYGTLADRRGLGGETDMARITVPPLPGDAGGPVLNADGAVLGMLLPTQTPSGRKLPTDVSFTRPVPYITEFLAQNFVNVDVKSESEPLDPISFDQLARDITVLINCWE